MKASHTLNEHWSLHKFTAQRSLWAQRAWWCRLGGSWCESRWILEVMSVLSSTTSIDLTKGFRNNQTVHCHFTMWISSFSKSYEIIFPVPITLALNTHTYMHTPVCNNAHLHTFVPVKKLKKKSFLEAICFGFSGREYGLHRALVGASGNATVTGAAANKRGSGGRSLSPPLHVSPTHSTRWDRHPRYTTCLYQPANADVTTYTCHFDGEHVQ